MAAVNACMMVGYVAGASLRGVNLESVEILTKGKLDLRGFLGLSDEVIPGYESIDYEVRIKGDGTAEDYEAIHQTVMKTSPNYFNLSRPIAMNAKLTVAWLVDRLSDKGAGVRFGRPLSFVCRPGQLTGNPRRLSSAVTSGSRPRNLR